MFIIVYCCSSLVFVWIVFMVCYWSKSIVYWVAHLKRYHSLFDATLFMGYCFSPIHWCSSSNYISQFNRLHSYSSDLIMASWSFVFRYGRSCTSALKKTKKSKILWRSAKQIFGVDSYFTKTSLHSLLFLWTWNLLCIYIGLIRHWKGGIRPSTLCQLGYLKKEKVLTLKSKSNLDLDQFELKWLCPIKGPFRCQQPWSRWSGPD